MTPSLQQFGSRSWTQDKLDRLRKYLPAYTKIMRSRPFRYAYIDGFAGTGYHELERDERAYLFDEVNAPEVETFLKGSAKVALEAEPRFHEYIFIEKSPRKAAELEKLRGEFPALAADVKVESADANVYLQSLCSERNWQFNRAVLFIDPFGMQLSWATLQAVGRTQAIDTWILFPVSAVNRLLKKDGNIPDQWRRAIDTMFGCQDWFDIFYPEEEHLDCASMPEQIGERSPRWTTSGPTSTRG